MTAMRHVRMLVAAGTLACLLTASLAQTRAAPSERSVYQLQSRWTTDEGRELELGVLGGRHQVVAFIFTTCAGVCPLLVKSLQIQARALSPQVRERTGFVLVSIDPAQDSVEALKRYRKSMALDANWTLLRGSEADLRELTAVIGFNYEKLPNGQFAHSNLITLLDPDGEIVLQHASEEGALQAFSSAIAGSK